MSVQVPEFTTLTDLASEAMGSTVIATNDDFFAEKENLIRREPAIWDEHKFTDRGKWMDGWESRRRRTPGYDWCIIKLGAAGIISGFDIDTSHFNGNQPETCCIWGTVSDAAPSEDDPGWTLLVDHAPLGSDAHHFVASANTTVRSTHLKIDIHPDGGVARLRAYGTVTPAWDRLKTAGTTIDLACASNGGRSLECSDMHFSHKDNLILPTPPRNMGEGWETKRRRGEGFDWITVQLGHPGTIEEVIVDTSFFKGNFPESISVDACLLADGAAPDDNTEWTPIVTRVPVHADFQHSFQPIPTTAGTAFSHVRLAIYPDGGVARLRVLGTATNVRQGS